ncbi:MAG TPA: class I SAM-dependent methyltransferase [Nodularia sp. (in: cyanobacteria)]|nr:class I SAM-dependent methyltransferase [Nodularia sp. (in: cyanobacteria)]
MISMPDETYKTAVNHYLSPKRQDNVKVKWERQFSRDLTQKLVSKLVTQSDFKSLSVIDFGCGIGEGLTLFYDIFKELKIDQNHLNYIGVDISPEMLKTASQKWQGFNNVEFLLQDFRDGIPDHPSQIYYSCGVPYSHLTQEEMFGVLVNIFKAIKCNQTESLILIDVLGRYSIEWITKWSESRWSYRMSFLAEAADSQTPMSMTCYYAPELTQLFDEAAKQSGCEILSLDFYDRSIMVGRHTTTNEYNPYIPAYRELVNSLYELEATDLQKLLLNCPLPDAPQPVKAFFATFAQEWNALIATAAQLRSETEEFAGICTDTSRAMAFREMVLTQRSVGTSQQTDPLELLLAEQLRQLEIELQPGLGISHTLIGVLEVKGV